MTSTLETRIARQPTDGGEAVVEHEDGGGGLADVVHTILDKGLVIDVFARASLVGIEVLRVDARVVVASVDTYLRFAETAGRLRVGQSEPAGLPDLVEDIQPSGSKSKAQGMLEAAEDQIEEVFRPDEEDEERETVERPRRRGVSSGPRWRGHEREPAGQGAGARPVAGPRRQRRLRQANLSELGAVA